MEKESRGLSRRDFMKLALSGVLAGTMLLSGCEPIISTITATPKPGDKPTSEVTPLPPTEMPTDVPAGSESTTPEAPVGRSIVTPEMARNVEPSLEIGGGVTDDHGRMVPTVYPENASDVIKSAIDTSYASIERLFPDSRVFFNQDTAPEGSGQWILYAIDRNGDLIHRIYSYLGSDTPGPEQYFDYPFSYDGLGNVRGDYTTIPFEGGLGVIWTGSGASRLPQFLSNERPGTGDDRYFTEAFKHDTLYPDDPWVEISEVESLLAPSVPDNPGYFEGVGEITEIELHNDKWYGIDTVGRAQIIFNAQTHEWEKYDRPIEVMYDLNYEDSYSLSPEILQDIEQTQISRLNTDGETLPWGLLQIEHPFEGYSFGHAYVSGYLLDVSSWSLGSDYVITNIVFEIPSRYNRQIINFIKLDGIWMFLDLYVIPDSGNVAEREQKPRTFHDFSTMLSNPDIIGSQIVLAFQINRLDSLPSGIQYEQDTYSKSDAALNSLIDAIGNGETYSSRSFTSAISRAWIPEAYFK